MTPYAIKLDACQKLARGKYVCAKDICCLLLQVDAGFKVSEDRSLIEAEMFRAGFRTILRFVLDHRGNYQMVYTCYNENDMESFVPYDPVAFFCFGE